MTILSEQRIALCLLLTAVITGCTSPGQQRKTPQPSRIALGNQQLKVTLAAELGRIMWLSPAAAPNFLHNEPQLAPVTEFYNPGGEFLWPTTQEHWKTGWGHVWPPPPLIDAPSWSARQWTTADGTRVCRLEQTLAAPLHAHALRQIEVPAHGETLRIRQSLARTAASTMPVTLWNISQIEQPDQIILPAGADGFVTLGGTTPGSVHVERNCLLIDFMKSDDVAHKLGVRATPAWIAARKGNVVIVQRASLSSGVPPDGGCSVELWWSRTAGYAELELLSAERSLALGESLANTVTMEFHRVPGNLTDAALVQRIEYIIHETKN